jgi:DNA topoisomerase-1
VLNGRYGPYVSDGKKNGKIPKDRDPKSLTLEECKALIAAAPERKGGWGRRGAVRGKAAAKSASPAAAGDATTPAKKKAAPKKKAAARKKATKKQAAAS